MADHQSSTSHSSQSKGLQSRVLLLALTEEAKGRGQGEHRRFSLAPVLLAPFPAPYCPPHFIWLPSPGPDPLSLRRLFSSLGELSTISAQRSPGAPGAGASYSVRPGGRYPVARRAPSPVKPASLERVEGLGAGTGGAGRPFGLTPPTILKSSSLSIPHEPKEVRFVVRSVSARSRSPSPSPLPSPAPGPGPSPGAPGPRRPFQQKPLQLWSKFDVGDWLESIHLGEHRDRFEDHEIEGAHLPALTKDDFVELGVTRVGHRMNIERALRQLDGS